MSSKDDIGDGYIEARGRLITKACEADDLAEIPAEQLKRILVEVWPIDVDGRNILSLDVLVARAIEYSFLEIM